MSGEAWEDREAKRNQVRGKMTRKEEEKWDKVEKSARGGKTGVTTLPSGRWKIGH